MSGKVEINAKRNKTKYCAFVCIHATCFGHSCGHFQGGALQRIHTSNYYRGIRTNAQI
jgi:hypothetical protein